MNKQKGFTLIEIMIALILGIIVIGGAISIYISTIRGSIDITNSARLNYDLDSAMQLMVNDIRRAGYWGGAIAGSDAINNPSDCSIPATRGNVFTCDASNIQIRNVATPTTVVNLGNCILYTYDGNDVANGVVDTSEYYGFRLNGTELEMRISGTAATALDCGVDVQWRNISDENKVNITSLQFSLSPIAAAVAAPPVPATPALTQSSQCLNFITSTAYVMPCSTAATTDTDGDGTNNLITGEIAVETRQINIILTGRVLDDLPVTKALTATVKTRNNRIFTQL